MKIKSLIFTLLFVSCSVGHAKDFSISSDNVKPNSTIADQHVFNGFGCEGKNISPQISWQNAPLNTKSFALTVYDPDAPTGSGWWHYLVVNIPSTYKKLPAGFGSQDKFGLVDNIKQIRNDYGVYNFGGPCPPKGDKPHRYIFTVFALKVEKLEVSQSSTAALAGYMINQNVLAKASFEATYGR